MLFNARILSVKTPPLKQNADVYGYKPRNGQTGLHEIILHYTSNDISQRFRV